MRLIWLALVSPLLAACPGGGGGSGLSGSASCTSMNTSRSYIDSNCVGCQIANPGDVADGSLASFADITLTDMNSQAILRAGNGGTMLPAGGRAGAFVTHRVDFADGGPSSNLMLLRTYLAGALAETGIADVEDAGGGVRFISFTTTTPFDAVEIEIGHTNAENLSTADVRVYEICSDGRA